MGTELNFLDRFDLSVGTVCNSKCVMCIDRGGEAMNELKSLAYYTKLLKEAREKGFIQVNLANLEPTLNPLLPKIIRIASLLGFKKISMNTNGTILGINKNIGENLLKSGMNMIIFSLHGVGEIHDKVTQTKGSFGKLVNGVKNIISLKKKYKIDVLISFVINRYNVHDMSNLARFLYEEGISKDIFILSFFYVMYDGRGLEKVDEISVSYKKAVEEYTNFLKSPYSKYFQTNIVNIPYCKINLDYVNNFSQTRRFFFDPDVIEKERKFRPSSNYVDECNDCFYKKHCEGVYPKYKEMFPEDPVISIREKIKILEIN